MTGKLFGIGVGPGDPELMTIKAVRLIKESSVIIVPGSKLEKSVAYKIAIQAVPQIMEKEVIVISTPMTKDKVILDASYLDNANIIKGKLDKGLQVAFLTLGDPTIYSTYIYIHNIIKSAGYKTEIISGITSFCATAARLNIGLVERAESLHVLPSSYEIKEGLKLKGTKILMKSGKEMKKVKEVLVRQINENQNIFMVENCGMEDEKIYDRIEKIPDNAGYYSLIIVKDKEEKR
jgi:precorrin-2 C20-methyltransferase